MIDLRVQLLGNYSTKNRSSIIVVKEENKLHNYLLQNNIITTHRNSLIRISIHFDNNDKVVDTIIKAIKMGFVVVILA